VMHAEVQERPDEVAVALHAMLERVGRKATRRRLGLQIALDRTPTQAELVAAAREYNIAIMTLTGCAANPV